MTSIHMATPATDRAAAILARLDAIPASVRVEDLGAEGWIVLTTFERAPASTSGTHVETEAEARETAAQTEHYIAANRAAALAAVASDLRPLLAALDAEKAEAAGQPRLRRLSRGAFFNRICHIRGEAYRRAGVAQMA